MLYDDGAEVILTATRDGLSKDSDNAKDWNDGQPTEASDKQAVSYRALFIAGPSDKGQELVKKVNAGEELTWEDLDSANWSLFSRRLHLSRPVAAGSLRQGHLRSEERRAV